MSEIGPISVRLRRRWRISSCPALKGIAGSSAHPIAMEAPSGTNRATASRMDMTFAVTPLAPLVLRLPFLGERGEALLRVLAGEEARDRLVLVRETVGKGHSVPE